MYLLASAARCVPLFAFDEVCLWCGRWFRVGCQSVCYFVGSLVCVMVRCPCYR